LHGRQGIPFFETQIFILALQMPVFSYQTIQTEAQGIYKEKGSKFLAFAYPVESEENVRQKLEVLKKEYFDARHHCYAYILGPEKTKYRTSDDGEPNHSAGDPILGQIRSKNLTDVLVVVVRYFGGVKLGVGGLISAYKSAAESALNAVAVIEKEVTVELNIQYDYQATPEVMRLIKEFDLIIKTQNFEETCTMTLDVSLKNKEALLEKIELLKATGTKINHH
jgi:uncharacterized YigZ family protein